MNNKTAAMVILVIGALLLLASLLADVIGIGDDAGFGRQQTMGTIAGVVVLAVGAFLYKKTDQGSDSKPDDAPAP